MKPADPDSVLHERLRELTVIADLAKTLTSTLELHDVLRVVLDRLKALTQAEALSLLLYDGERDELVFAATETLRENCLVGLRVPVGQGIAGWVMRTGRSALVNDVHNDARFYGEIDRTSQFSTRNILAVPFCQEGRMVGVVEVLNRYEGGAFTEADRVTLEGVVADAAERFDPQTLSTDADGMRALLARVSAAVPSEASSLLLYDPAGHELAFTASRTLQAGIVDGLRLPCSQGIAGWVARHRQPLCLDDASHDPRYYRGVEDTTQLTPHRMLCVPMVSKDTLLGVIQVINKLDGSPFSDEEFHLAQVLADHAAIAVENASLYRQMYIASITDDLTGLYNTRYFNQLLPQLTRRRDRVSLLVLDLDNFKTVVDTYGHLAGSRTIGHLGKVIGHLVRPGDIAARFGGDEFVVILPDTDTEAAQTIAETIRAAIETCSTPEGNGIDISVVTASVGIATFPDHARDAESLFRAADAAMYTIKRRGKNGVAVATARASSVQ
jgi:diguanylate cyclase (GGDEF)-like protein